MSNVWLSPNFKKLQRVLEFARPHRNRILLAMCLALLGSALQLGQLTFLRSTVDHALDGFATAAVARYASLFIACLLLAIIAEATHIWLMTLSTQTITVDIQNRIHRHLHKLSDEFFSNCTAGDLSHRMIHDAASAQQLIGITFGSLIRYPLSLILISAYMLWLDSVFALVTLFGFLLVVIVSLVTTRSLQAPAYRISEHRARINHRFLTLLEARHLLKIYDTTGKETERVPEDNAQYLTLARGFLLKKSILHPVSQILTAMVSVGLIFWGAYRMQTGIISGGTATAMLASVLLLYRLIVGISRIAITARESQASIDRIFEVLDYPVSPSQSASGMTKNIDMPIISLAASDVSFSYASRHFYLKDINFELHAGTIYLLRGATGSGKSTLLRLVSSDIKPCSGFFSINGIPTDRHCLQSLRKQMVIIPQRCPIIGDTIQEEITVSNPDVSNEELVRVATDAQLLNWIKSLPDGWNTHIGPGGLAVSGGERQRMAIARLLLHPRPIILLDEATSELDLDTEVQVMNVLSEHVKRIRGICLISSHRIDNLYANCKTLELRDGRLSKV